MELQEPSFTAGGKLKWCSHLEDSLAASYKTEHALTIRSSNHSLWYLSKWIENLCLHRTTWFRIAKTWKQPRCLSVGEWINCGPARRWNILQLKEEMSYQAMKRHEKNLKCILPSERNQPEKITHCMIPTIWLSGKGKTMARVKGSVVARG